MKILSSHSFSKFLYFENQSGQKKETEETRILKRRTSEKWDKKENNFDVSTFEHLMSFRFPLLLKGERLSN